MKAHEYITVTLAGDDDAVADAMIEVKQFVHHNATVKRVLVGTLTDSMSPEEIAEWDRRTTESYRPVSSEEA